MSRIASRIIIIEMMSQCTATQVLMKRAQEDPKIEINCGLKIKSIIGDDNVKGLELVNIDTGEESKLEVDGIFVYIGLEPNTEYLKGILELDNEGQIMVNDMMETNIAGCFGAGDVRHNSTRQVVTATGDGAIAALSAIRFLMENK